MMAILETFKKSIYNPDFYQSAGDTPFSEVFRYYSKFALILSIIMTIALSILLIPAGVLFVKKYAPEMVKNYFPQELTVNIEKGVATANLPMPYFVPIRGTFASTTPIAMKNMLVIDTTSSFDKKKFEEYNTYVLLTDTDIVTSNESGQITIQSLRVIPKTTISQDSLLGWIENIKNYTGRIVIIGMLGTFIIVILGYLMYLVPLFLFALIPLLIAYIKKIKISYASAYKISMYAIIPALALKTLLNIVGILFIPSYFTLLVFMLIIAVNMRESKQPELFNN